MGMYDEVKVTVPMIVRYVHNDKIREKRNTSPSQALLDTVGISSWQLLDNFRNC
jgi:hypothetical protein